LEVGKSCSVFKNRFDVSQLSERLRSLQNFSVSEWRLFEVGFGGCASRHPCSRACVCEIQSASAEDIYCLRMNSSGWTDTPYQLPIWVREIDRFAAFRPFR
jgi:hypothetical protein